MAASSKPLSKTLTPKKELSSSLSTLGSSGKGFYDNVVQMGMNHQIAEIPLVVQKLFLNEVQPYAIYLGNEGKLILNQIDDIFSDLINLKIYVHKLSVFLKSRLDDIQGDGFHPILHMMVKAKMNRANTWLQNLVANCKDLCTILDNYRLKVNDFISQLNKEIDELKKGPQFLHQEFNNICNAMAYNQAYNYRAYLMNMYRYCVSARILGEQDLIETSPAFKAGIKQQILSVINTFKDQGTSIVSSVTNMGTTWETMQGELSTTIDDLNALSSDFPQSLKVLTKIDLENLEDDWKKLGEQIDEADSEMCGTK